MAHLCFCLAHCLGLVFRFLNGWGKSQKRNNDFVIREKYMKFKLWRNEVLLGYIYTCSFQYCLAAFLLKRHSREAATETHIA